MFVALATGGAYAADTIFSEDIVDGEVKSVDIRTGGVASVDVLNNALTASDIGPQAVGSSELANGKVGAADLGVDAVTGVNVAPDSLGGDDLDEASLGTVPQAGDASTLGGASEAELDTRAIGPFIKSCNPVSATFADCGAASAVPSFDAESDVLVNAAGGWCGIGAGTEEGSA